jgi:hypothetical protein
MALQQTVQLSPWHHEYWHPRVKHFLIAYLRARHPWLVNYRQRRIEQPPLAVGMSRKRMTGSPPGGKRTAACSGARRQVIRWPHCAR